MRTFLTPFALLFATLVFPGEAFGEAGSATNNTRETVDVPGAVCADGSQSFVNVIDRGASDLFIAVHGGGACWDALSCGCDPRTETCNGTLIARDLTRPDPAKQGHPWSVDSLSPVGGFNVIEVPYCSGDLFTGNRTATYSHVTNGKSFKVVYAGFNAMKQSLAYAKNRFPNVNRVLVMGTSAGGYGVTFGLRLIAQAFPNASVNVIGDSSAPLQPPYVSKASFDRIYRAWGSTSNFPTAIQAGADGVVDFDDFIGYNAKTFPNVRYGLDSAGSDIVIETFVALFGDKPFRAVANCVADTEVMMDQTSNAKYYTIPGVLHGISQWPADLTVSNSWFYQDWVRAMINGSSAWQSTHGK